MSEFIVNGEALYWFGLAIAGVMGLVGLFFAGFLLYVYLGEQSGLW